MPEKFVVNASPLIILGKINQLHLLPSLADELVVPYGVFKEILAGSPGDPAREWLNGPGKAFVKEIGPLEPEVLKWDLGLGETEVLTFAYRNRDFIALLDDRAARKCAKTLDIKTKGTLAILVLARKRKLLPDITTVLDRIEQAGFYVSPSLLKAVKRLASE
ncbi:hypothetical protein Thein_1499 [Thermodesulfatator indicus DSM 15286]|uniref:DUF3368 domain-containing protein n=1 Tax=Thermodesulfatator indicus (strain DSM 15286 / JCM 11887 / CIR29812) TaxID=667014 RepID=F8AAE1_THEID|nr:DUF3368 domain-containing protein [Thermodesulfatator indicus]AEH45361.1 hypothetical protein Thein_1499 [Thermodesulfatator indicus DSM 15286]